MRRIYQEQKFLAQVSLRSPRRLTRVDTFCRCTESSFHKALVILDPAALGKLQRSRAKCQNLLQLERNLYMRHESYLIFILLARLFSETVGVVVITEVVYFRPEQNKKGEHIEEG